MATSMRHLNKLSAIRQQTFVMWIANYMHHFNQVMPSGQQNFCMGNAYIHHLSDNYLQLLRKVQCVRVTRYLNVRPFSSFLSSGEQNSVM